MNQNKQHYLLNRAEDACSLLKKHLDQDHVVRIISHNDADGISAAGVICNAINREGGKFHVTIVPRLKAEILDKVSREKYPLFVFCDMGSAWIQRISQLKGDAIVADHHQTIDQPGHDLENVVHVNPHLFGLDGTRDISASGVSYLTVKPLNNEQLAGMALVGAFGDMQCADGIKGVNQTIMQDGLNKGALEVREDLKIAYRSQEPLYKALSYTFQPAIKDISGDPEGAMAFLEKIGISYGVKFSELANEEKDLLKDELIKKNSKIFGDTYHITQEKPPLRNVEDYSNILDACGKTKEYGTGLSICLGDKEKALPEGMELLKKYQINLSKGLEWIKKEGSTEMPHLQYIYTEDKNKKSLMGSLSSISLEMGIINPDKPVLAFSRMDNLLKVSGRATHSLIQKGVNLGKALKQASNSFNGAGGGHNIAAGAVVPYKHLTGFTHLMDDIIRSQMKS